MDSGRRRTRSQTADSGFWFLGILNLEVSVDPGRNTNVKHLKRLVEFPLKAESCDELAHPQKIEPVV